MPAAEVRIPGGAPVTRFARDLRQRRSELGLTQAELADELGVQTQTISQWERSIKNPQPRFADRLVELLGLTDKSELREAFNQVVSIAGKSTVARTLNGQAPSKSDRLSLVPEMEASVGDVTLPNAAPGAFAEADRIMESALKIIVAKDGRLSPVEAEIVKSLISSARAREPRR